MIRQLVLVVSLVFTSAVATADPINIVLAEDGDQITYFSQQEDSFVCRYRPDELSKDLTTAVLNATDPSLGNLGIALDNVRQVTETERSDWEAAVIAAQLQAALNQCNTQYWTCMRPVWFGGHTVGECVGDLMQCIYNAHNTR